MLSTYLMNINADVVVPRGLRLDWWYPHAPNWLGCPL